MKSIQAIRKELEKRRAETLLGGGRRESRNSIKMESSPPVNKSTFSSIQEHLLN